MTPRAGKRMIRDERTPDLNREKGGGTFQVDKKREGIQAEESMSKGLTQQGAPGEIQKGSIDRWAQR